MLSNSSKNSGLYDQFDHNAYCYRRDTLLKPQILYRKNCIQSILYCISRRSKTAKIKC